MGRRCKRGGCSGCGCTQWEFIFIITITVQSEIVGRAEQAEISIRNSNSCINKCAYSDSLDITHTHTDIMERLLDLFDKADPFSTWWPTIAAVVVGLVITVRWVKGVLWQAVALWHTKRGSGRLSEELRQSVAAPHHTFSWGNLRKSAMIRKVQKAAGAEVASLHRQTLPDTLRHIHLYRYIYPYISHRYIYIYIYLCRAK